MNIVTVTQIYPINNTYHIDDFMHNYVYPPPPRSQIWGDSNIYSSPHMQLTDTVYIVLGQQNTI